MIVKNVEKKENNEVTFQVEVDKDAFEEAVNGAYLKNKKTITVPGFRKGKAPRMVIEGMYGAEVFYEDAFEDLAPKAFAFATEQEKLKTVGRPNLTDTDVSDDKTLTLSFEAALYPEVKLGKYKGVEAPRDDDTVTDEKVDEYIEEMRKRNARQITVERAAKMGDTVVIDYDGYLDGERFEGGKAEEQTLELGSNRFVPGFEEQIVGMEKHPIGDLTEVTLSKIKEMVDVNTVVGTPITTPDGITLIPVSRVSLGFANAGGDLKSRESAFGGGNGAGIKIEPVGFLCIQDGGVRMINIGSPASTSLDRLIEIAPEMIDKGEQLYKKYKNK